VICFSSRRERHGAIGLIVACLTAGWAHADDGASAELVLVGKSPMAAQLASIDDRGMMKFQSPDGGEVAAGVGELVRWSTLASPRAADELWLIDGSRVCLAPSWGATPSLTLGPQRGEAETRLLGRAAFDRSALRAVLWGLPPDDIRRQQTLDTLLAASAGKTDALLVDNGDVLTGRLIAVGPGKQASGQERSTTAIFEGELGRVELALERVRGIALGNRRPPTTAKLRVGLRDGSSLAVEGLTTDDNELAIRSDVLGSLEGRDRRDIAFLQSSAGVRYLSDADPANYRHQPYLNLHWPFRRDRNVLNGPLAARGKAYGKGLGMHSAAQLTFARPANYDRFAATIAVDDEAAGGGSVTFRVLQRGADRWEPVFESPPLRGSDAPRAVAVDVRDAREIALVVDYGERGDERDYADWLDARWEQASSAP
jgi:hypothetical protein